MKQLPKSIKFIWLQSAGFSFLAWLIFGIIYFVMTNFWSWLPAWGFGIIMVLMVIEVVVEIILIPYRYAFYKYQVTETDVEIKKGYFFRKDVSIPIARVQNVDLNQGPLLRLKRLYSVTIATGGSSHDVEALTHQEANYLKDRVMSLAREARNEK